MFAIENIIRSVTRNKEDKAHILIINNMYDDYINLLCQSNHFFYLINGINEIQQWSMPNRPYNLTIFQNPSFVTQRFFDYIISLDRINSYHKALELSTLYHIPLIHIDLCTSNTIIKRPFFTQVNIHHPLPADIKSVANICIDNIIASSYPNNKNNIVVPIPAVFQLAANGNKILIDGLIQKEYLNVLNINQELLTYNIEESKYYLHLWQCITPLLIQCMNSNIPVITFPCQELSEFQQHNLCHFINHPTDINHIIYNINNDIVNNAKNYVNIHCSNNFFINIFNNIFNTTTFYNRG